MVAKTKQRKKNAGRAARAVRARGAMVPRSPSVSDKERRLLDLITDPCGAQLTGGYALSTEGIVQRFSRLVVPNPTNENSFAYIFNPVAHGANPFSAIRQRMANGISTSNDIGIDAPGEGFIDTNADHVATLAACMQVLYTGTLVNRKGYIGVCQASADVLQVLATSPNPGLVDLLTYCQHIAPITSEMVEVKWSPSIRNFKADNSSSETGGSYVDNSLMVVAIGVNPADFVVRFTSVYEYVPKFALGIPAPRATVAVPVGAGERIVTALNNAGVWWHNLGKIAGATGRMAMSIGYNAGRVFNAAQAVRGVASNAAMLALTL